MSRGEGRRDEERAAGGVADALNRGEQSWVRLDAERLRERLEAELGASGLLESHPTLLAASPVFVSRADLERMRRIVTATEAVVASEGYRAWALEGVPETARVERRAGGAFLGYDFHLSPGGPELIEINTNAGGALLNLYLGQAQRPCCDPVRELVGEVDADALEETLLAMFRREWRLERGRGGPRRVAIVDEEPAGQFLYPELRLFERLFERHGIRACVVDPSALEIDGGALRLGGAPVDLVYNRLTDFYLESPRTAALREALLRGAAVVTPGPRAHALYANKRNLTVLSDPERLRSFGVAAEHVAALASGVPHTRLVTPENADALWARRRELFFKPLAGYGSRGTYRGSKLTKRVWGQIVAADYVAQRWVPPSERRVRLDGELRSLKLDVRCYVYRGEIQLLGARMYRGQATNLRTEGGGLATVFTTR